MHPGGASHFWLLAISGIIKLRYPFWDILGGCKIIQNYFVVLKDFPLRVHGVGNMYLGTFADCPCYTSKGVTDEG